MADLWAQYVDQPPAAAPQQPPADAWAQYAAPSAPAPQGPAQPDAAPALLQEGSHKWGNGAIADFADPDAPKAAPPTPTAPDERSTLQKVKDALTYDYAPDIQNLGKALWNHPAGAAGVVAGNAANSIATALTPLTGKVDLNSPDAVAGNAGNMMNLTGLLTAGTASPGSVGSRKLTPTGDQLFTKGGEQLKSSAASPVEFDPSHVAGVSGDIKQGISTGGNTLSSAVAPQIHSLLDELANPPSDAVGIPIGQLHNATSKLGELQRDNAGTPEGTAARLARQQLLGFLKDAPPESIVAGAAAYPEAKQQLIDGMGNWAAGERSGYVTGSVDNAELRAATNNSGQNSGNLARGRMATLVQNPPTDPTAPSIAARSGFSPEEIDDLTTQAKGTRFANAARSIGNTLGGGGGLGRMIGLGAGALAGHALEGGLAGTGGGAALGEVLGSTAFGAAGKLAKSLENSSVTGGMRAAAERIRQRSPMFQSGEAGQEAVFPSAQSVLVRALMAQQQPNQQQ